jgi:putative Mn2+ efflux pump MntP
MNFITIFLVAVGLAVDAFSVAIGIGTANTKRSWAPVLRLAGAFGLFQFVMPIAGWLAGLTVVNFIGGFDHWIAFALLTYVGGKMIWEGFEKDSDEEKADQTRGWPLLLLSIATSIDALAVGFSFSILKEPILFPAAIIGIVCFLMTAVGMIFGKVLAKIFGKKVEIFGGIVLIAIGVKILFDHLL